VIAGEGKETTIKEGGKPWGGQVEEKAGKHTKRVDGRGKRSRVSLHDPAVASHRDRIVEEKGFHSAKKT